MQAVDDVLNQHSLTSLTTETVGNCLPTLALPFPRGTKILKVLAIITYLPTYTKLAIHQSIVHKNSAESVSASFSSTGNLSLYLDLKRLSIFLNWITAPQLIK